MSNGQLDVFLLALFGVHLAVLASGLVRRGRAAVLGLSGADAAVVLAWLAFHPLAFRAPVDWPVVGLAAFEIAVLAAVTLVVRGVRVAAVAVWLAFAAHLVVSGLALLFALTFKITRLF